MRKLSHIARVALGSLAISLGYGCGDPAAPPTDGPTQPASPRAPGPPDFARDVAPLLHRSCAVCHRPGEVAPFPLLTYEDAFKRARQIAIVTSTRFMPPWLPAPNADEFAGRRALDEDEIDLLQRWVAAGAPEGDPSQTPEPPEFPTGWALGEPDLVVEMVEEYELGPEGTDVFRNFVLPVDLDRRRWVRAVDFQPGNKRIVHHAVVNVDETSSSRRLDAQDRVPGFDGMYSFTNATSPAGFFVGWTPGKSPYPGEEGVAWRLEKGADLVLQLHLQPTGRTESIRSRIGLYFAERAPRLRPSLLRLGSLEIDIAAGDADYTFTDSYRLPVAVTVLAIYPHAHYLGKEMRAWATPPGGARRDLLHIPEWDFNWQDDFRYERPFTLPAGTLLEVEYTYDNSSTNVRNPNHPPRAVRYGPRSEDEMGDLWLQVRAASEEDRRRLETDWGAVERAAQIAGHRFALAANPASALDHAALSHYALLEGKLEEAVELLRRAVELKPDYALAHTNLGWALEHTGDLDGALEHYRIAIQLDPLAADAHNNLGNLLARQGARDEALAHLRRALEIEPDLSAALNNLGNVLAAGGAHDRARPLFEEATLLQPDNASAHYNLGNALLSLGEVPGAESAYREAIRLAPATAQAHHNLAMVLLRSNRRGEAIESLRRAVRAAPDYQLAQRNLALQLRSQAADERSRGAVDEARRSTREALDAARHAGDAVLAQQLERELARE